MLPSKFFECSSSLRASKALTRTKKSLGLTKSLFRVCQCFSGLHSSKSNLRMRFGTSLEISMKAMCRPKHVREPRPYCPDYQQTTLQVSQGGGGGAMVLTGIQWRVMFVSCSWSSMSHLSGLKSSASGPHTAMSWCSAQLFTATVVCGG